MKRQIAIAAIALTASAAAWQGSAQAQMQRPTIISLSQAVAAAEKAHGGKAFDAELDSEHGVLAYEVDVVHDGRAMEVRIDAATGQVLKTARATPVTLPWDRDHLRAVQTAPKSLTQVIAAVEADTKGQVKDIGLERERGRYYYEVELAGAQDREVRVDMLTGAMTPVIDD